MLKSFINLGDLLNMVLISGTNSNKKENLRRV